MEQEDPKEVFKALAQVLEALLVAYHEQYPIHPANTMTMVFQDFGRWMAEYKPDTPEGGRMMIPTLEMLGDDLSTRIGKHSVYQQAREALASGGE